MRLWAFKSRMGSLGGLWIIMLAPLIFLAMMWRPLNSRISVTGLLSAAVVWVVVLVALFVWQAAGERRIARQSRGSPTPLL
jgi:Na+/proline symporter